MKTVARLSLSLLGQYKITLDAQELDLGYNQVRALLAYLAIESDRAHSRDVLAVLLWPDSPEIAARKNLRQALTTLRAAIRDESARPPFLLITRETIQLNPSADIDSDAAEFTALVEANASHAHKSLAACPACIDRLTRAAGLYKGDLLKNLTIPDSMAFEEWLLLARERMRLQMIDGLGRLVAASEHKADNEAAIQFSRRRLVLDPWNEDAYRALMRVLARCGQRTAALVEFERCKRLLAEELDIEPSAETVMLYDRIRTESGSQIQSVPSERTLPGTPCLPVPLTSLIGREKEISDLLDLLRQERVRLVTLMGSPGIGKTRLSMQVAAALAGDFEGNVYFVSLADITSPSLTLPTIVMALGLGESARLAPIDQLQAALLEQKALLVLDTFEQVVDAAPNLADLLRACPRLKILVTARSPLHLRGEQRFMLHPLALPDPYCSPDTGLVGASPAVRLFVERVQAVMPEFNLSTKNAETIAAICRRLDGLPLAIELAAASIRLMSPQRLLERLNGEGGSAFQVLKAESRDGDAHHQTLLQAFQWSYDLLDASTQTLFTRLGVFVHGCTLEAADAVCNVGDIHPASMDGIAALLDNCLLQQEEGIDGEYRFTLLTTLREFTLDRLAANGEWDALRQRHADYFLTFAKLAEPELTGKDQIVWSERVEKDLDNLRAALDWTLASSPLQALQLAVALFPFWHVRSYLNEGRGYLEQALIRNPHPGALRARALAITSLMAQRQGDYGLALELVEESVRICRELDEHSGLAYALNNQAIVLMSMGENRQALQVANESLALSHHPDYPLGIARAHMIIGQIALNEDRLEAACQALETSLSFWRRSGDMKNAVLCQINLGRARLVSGNYPEAYALIEESLNLSRKIKDRHWEMVALWNLAEIHLQLGSLEEGAPLLADCLEQARRLGDRFIEATSLSRLGRICINRAEMEEGTRLFNASLELGRQIGSKWIIADGLSHLGTAALRSGQLQTAEAMFSQSLDLFHLQGELGELVHTLEQLALTYYGQARFARAARMFGAAQAWRSASGEPLPPVERLEQEHALAGLKSQLGSQEWTRLWAEGQSLTLDQAAAYALDPAA